MPLFKGKSKKAFEHNIKTEMHAGKPQDQALAIAYSIQRKNKKKMAHGGLAKMDERLAEHDQEKEMDNFHDERRVHAYAEGDLVEPDYNEELVEEEEEEHQPAASMADEILRRKHAKMYAEGGEVDLDENAHEDKNLEDDLSFEALKKENYSEEDALDESSHPEDSNMHGHELEDEHDMVDVIRRKMKSKRGM